MVMLAKIRRMHLRDGMSVREVSRHTGLSRNTVRRWLRQGAVEPVYPARKRPCIIDAYREQLEVWLRTDSHRPRRDRRTANGCFISCRRRGFRGRTVGRRSSFVAGGHVVAVLWPSRRSYRCIFRRATLSSLTGAVSMR